MKFSRSLEKNNNNKSRHINEIFNQIIYINVKMCLAKINNLEAYAIYFAYVSR
jgi:hypothetical protein